MKKRQVLFLVAVGLAAFLVRLIWILHSDNSTNVWGDWWDDLAWSLASGHGYRVDNPVVPGDGFYYSWRPPAFPVFLAVIYRVFGHSFLAGKIGLAVLGVCSAVLACLVAGRFFNRSTGRLTAWAMALYPTFIFFSGYLAPETLTLMLMLAFLFFLSEEGRKPSLMNYAFAGVFLGLAVLCRTILFLFFIFILLWLVLNREHWVRILYRMSVLVACMALMVAPWVMRNYRIHGVFMLHSTDGGQALYINNNRQSFTDEPSGFSYAYDPEYFRGRSEVETAGIFAGSAKEYIRYHPRRFLQFCGKRLINFWRPFPHTVSGPGTPYTGWHQLASGLYTVPVFILAAAGVWFSRRQWRNLSLIYFLVVYYSGTYALVRATVRYRMPLEPYLLMFACFAAWYIIGRLRARRADTDTPA